MMSFSALVNITVFSGVAIVILKYIFKDNKAILGLDIRFMRICLLLILLRGLIPVESPLTHAIAVERIFPDVYMFLKEPIGSMGDETISLLGMLKVIWAVGSIIAVWRRAVSYIRLGRKLAGFSVITDEWILSVIQRIQKERKHPAVFRLVTTELADTPFVFGIWQPYIVVPQMKLTEKELELILRHETLHYYRGDLLIRFVCEGFKAIYWWNPFAYMLGNLIAQVQEINVDFGVMKQLSEAEQLDYSECLVKVAKMREKPHMEIRWSAAFQKEDSLSVRKRISLMLDHMDGSRKKTVASLLLSVAILFLIAVCPNVFIFQPYGISEEDAQGSFGIRDGGVFYIKNAEGTYDFYLGGEYVMTNEQIMDENIPIYESLEEAERAGISEVVY